MKNLVINQKPIKQMSKTEISVLEEEDNCFCIVCLKAYSKTRKREGSVEYC